MVRKYYRLTMLAVLFCILCSYSFHNGKTSILKNIPSRQLNEVAQIAHVSLPYPLQNQAEKRIFFYGIFSIIGITLFTYYYIKIKLSREKTLHIYEAETRLAKKIHDEIANDIYNSLCYASSNDLSVPEKKEYLLNSLNTIYIATRNVCKEINTIDTGSNYQEQLKYMLTQNNKKGVNVIIKGMDTINWKKIRKSKKIAVYRSLQELIVNMNKHSQANIVMFDFKQKRKNILISYSDNGLGISTRKNIVKNKLLNMENRMDSINGKVIFEPRADKGFHLILSYPV